MRRSNEELALEIQNGVPGAEETLLRQNKGLLSMWASSIQRRYDLDLAEDLLQEGGVAILDAARKYDPDSGVKLMSYAGASIRQTMKDCAAAVGTPLSVPSARLRQIRAAAYWASTAPQDWPKERIVPLVSDRMKVSPRIAERLLAEAGTLLTCEALDEYRETPSGYGDPEGVYERRLLRKHLLWLAEEYLDPREQTLARFYFGLGDHAGDGMALEELAVRLNYNSPSGARKALDRAIQKLMVNFESGEWGRWQGAKEVIRLATQIK